jgi:hypothetical protein
LQHNCLQHTFSCSFDGLGFWCSLWLGYQVCALMLMYAACQSLQRALPLPRALAQASFKTASALPLHAVTHRPRQAHTPVALRPARSRIPRMGASNSSSMAATSSEAFAEQDKIAFVLDASANGCTGMFWCASELPTSFPATSEAIGTTHARAPAKK